MLFGKSFTSLISGLRTFDNFSVFQWSKLESLSFESAQGQKASGVKCLVGPGEAMYHGPGDLKLGKLTWWVWYHFNRRKFRSLTSDNMES